MKRPRASFSLLILVLGLTPALAAGSWLDRARDSTLQLVGRCDSRSSRWEGGAIYSYCGTSVLRVVQGQPDPSLVVRQRGGEVDGIAQKVTHVTQMEPGKTYLLFLTKDDSGSWSPTPRGVNLVVDSPDLGPTVAGEPLDEVIRQLGGGN